MTTLIQEIINVFKKQGNRWMDYNEIYNFMDKSLFGPNKYGERGKKNIVYRLILGNEIFDEDPNFRPKKFKLKSHILQQKDVDEIERVYSTGDVKIFTNSTQFEEVKFSHEDEFETEVKNNYKLIFGSDAVYYDIKTKIGKRICDAIVFNPQTKKVYVVENELFIHDLYGHIVPQIIDFFNGMKDEKTKQNLKYEVSWEKDHKLPIIESIDRGNYDIIVIIDRITFKIEDVQRNIRELLKHFVENTNVDIIFKEFNVFIDENKNKIFRIK